MSAFTAEGASQTDREGKQLNDGRVGAVRKDHIVRYEINDEIIVFIPLFIYLRSIYVKMNYCGKFSFLCLQINHIR